MTQIQSFAFDPRGEGPSTVESSNGSVLRVVWICFNADQFRAIIHDNKVLAVSGEIVPGASSRRAWQ